jgi:hypothetical protein
MPVRLGHMSEELEVQFVALKGSRYSGDNTAVVLTDIEYRLPVDSDFRRAWIVQQGVVLHADRPEPTPDAEWKEGLAT